MNCYCCFFPLVLFYLFTGLFSYHFIDSQYISITEFKGGLFKRNTKGKLKLYEPRKTKVEIKHTNPYFKNTGTAAYMFQKKPNKGYLGGVVHGAIIGFLGGMLLILSP